MPDAFEEHVEVVRASAASLRPAIDAAGAALAAAAEAGAKVLAMGNGGSAAQALHLAAELSGRYALDRRPVAAVALPADVAAVTAVGNDYGFEQVFARQVEALARPDDVVVAISTSGTSPNVVAGARAARAAGATVVALTGAGGGDLGSLADHLVAVPSDQTPRVQEVHAIVLHLWAEAVETALTRRAAVR